MNYEGSKYLIFNVIPITYNRKESEWGVDIENQILADAANFLVVVGLKFCTLTNCTVPLKEREEASVAVPRKIANTTNR